MSKLQKEGFIQVPGGRTWYKITGGGNNSPLILLHGGPGYPHDYLLPLIELSNNREVVFYDQLGCGNSERPDDNSLWTVDRFVLELGQIIQELGYANYHLLGQSWGSALGAAFALTKPQGLKSLILSNPYLSSPQWENDTQLLLKELPKDMQQALKDNNINSNVYKKAWKEYYYRFVYRLKEPLPTDVLKSNNKWNYALYKYMWGPTEFEVTGTLKNFDLTSRLSEIEIPVLLLCGKYDESTPQAIRHFKGLLHNASSHVFENSAHFPFWTEKADYIDKVQEFLQQVE